MFLIFSSRHALRIYWPRALVFYTAHSATARAGRARHRCQTRVWLIVVLVGTYRDLLVIWTPLMEVLIDTFSTL